MCPRVEAVLNAEGFRIPIVAARWNELVTERLAAGAERALRMHGIHDPEVFWVSGTWEVPVLVHALIEEGADAVVCVGCVLRGDTIHAQQLSNSVAGAVADLMMRTGVPVTWGILTCATQEEALERAGLKKGNKGEEAALAAIEAVCQKKKRSRSV
ncbi:MAG: 6,7-dimethyl-8-ribityllumazine synthase [Armatimonadota bacterium]